MLKVKPPKLNRSQKTVAFSFALHLGVALIFLFTAQPPRQPVQHSTVELMDPDELAKMLKRQQDDQKQGQIVEQNEKPINDEKPEDAKYFSRNNQVVKRETKAAKNGQFKNTASQAEGPKADEIKAAKNRSIENLNRKDTAKSKSEKPANLAAAQRSGDQAVPSLQSFKPDFSPHPRLNALNDQAAGGGDGPSATDDHLKDVETGMQTLLSTREFLYYSYYNRIKEKLRQYWEPKIKEKVERVFREGRTIASTTDKITKIIILLDSSGTLVRVQVVGPSGVTDLDDAAVEAFRAAAPFPNPPKGIIENDGLIRIHWDFILEANAGKWMHAGKIAANHGSKNDSIY